MNFADVRFDLRDCNPAVVDAWAAHFAGVDQVRVQPGDIFQDEADALVSPANSFGFMDGGIDLAFSEQFGWHLQARVQERIRRDFHGELLVGQAFVVPTLDAVWPHLICAPTMRVPADVSGTPNAFLAFRAALLAVQAHNASGGSPIRRVACPGLGTAIGRMAPDVCARQMRAAYDAAVLGRTPELSTLQDAKLWHVQLTRADL